MKTFQVLTDSTSDLTKEDRENFGIDYLKMTVSVDGNNYDADLDWESGIEATSYFNKMRLKSHNSTSHVPQEEFIKKFKTYLDEGLDILYIGCSSKLSDSVNEARIAANDVLVSYPGRRVIVFDSLRSNYAEGLMAIQAAKFAYEGKTLEETVTYLNSNKLKYQTFGTVGNLQWMRKSGKIKVATALIGNFLGVKQIIVSDASGDNFAFRKIKGRKNSLQQLIDMVISRVENASESRICIEHADSENDARYIAAVIRERISPKEITVSLMGPVTGATVGPDTITVSFYGKEITLKGE